jgi:hypothetical protein
LQVLSIHRPYLKPDEKIPVIPIRKKKYTGGEVSFILHNYKGSFHLFVFSEKLKIIYSSDN